MGTKFWSYDHSHLDFVHFFVLGVTIFYYDDNGILIWSKISHLTISITKFLLFETMIIAFDHLEVSKMNFSQSSYFFQLPPLVLCNQLFCSNFWNEWLYFNQIFTLIRWWLLPQHIPPKGMYVYDSCVLDYTYRAT